MRASPSFIVTLLLVMMFLWQVVPASADGLDGWAYRRPTLGEAIVQAKAAVRDPDIRRTWLLFGDPTIRLSAQN